MCELAPPYRVISPAMDLVNIQSYPGSALSITTILSFKFPPLDEPNIPPAIAPKAFALFFSHLFFEINLS